MRDVLVRLEILAAWLKPGGQTPDEPIPELKRGLTGAKPEAVCHWAFELLGARPEDELHDLFPGSGAVERAWKTWQGKFTLPPFKLEAAE